MKVEQYIRCPRCELNFIKKKDKLCSVCKAELAADPNDVDEMEMETCPICKTNFIRPDEIMCKSCLKERSLDDIITANTDDEWDNYVNQEEDMSSEDEETGDMASITDLDSNDIDELEIDDSDLPDLDEEINFDEEDKDDDDDEDDFDDDDDLDDFDDLDDDDED